MIKKNRRLDLGCLNATLENIRAKRKYYIYLYSVESSGIMMRFRLVMKMQMQAEREIAISRKLNMD